MATAKRKAKVVKKFSRGKSWKPWQRRLASAVIFIFCLLLVLGLMIGPSSLKQDMDTLRESRGMLHWFSAARGDTSNPVGLFGILLGNLFVWLLGYLFSIVSFVIIGVIALLYFLDPDAPRTRQKALLILILIFLLQIMVSAKDRELGFAVFPGLIWSMLAAVFSPVGATIILIATMLLSLILIFEWRRVKQWTAMLIESFEHRGEDPPIKKGNPTINQDEPLPTKQFNDPEPTPVIQDHSQTTPPA